MNMVLHLVLSVPNESFLCTYCQSNKKKVLIICSECCSLLVNKRNSHSMQTGLNVISLFTKMPPPMIKIMFIV